MTTATEFQHKGRTFTVTGTIPMAELSKVSFEIRGFEGAYYTAKSFRTGLQRKTIEGMFLKTKGGEFIPAF